MTLGFCPKCGTARTGDRFCAKCGEDFQAQANPQPNRTMTQSVIRAQAQNTLPRLAAIIVFFVVGGGVLFLTSDGIGLTQPLLWLGLSFGAGLVAAWAVGTWLLVRLA